MEEFQKEIANKELIAQHFSSEKWERLKKVRKKKEAQK